MTPEVLKKARNLELAIDRCRRNLESWENMEAVPVNLLDCVMEVPPDAWRVFRNSCRGAAQKKMDALEAELRAL